MVSTKATSATSEKTKTCTRLFLFDVDRRTAIASSLLWTVAASPSASSALDSLSPQNDATEGLASVTRSALGQSVRRGAVRGAQIADRLDRSWERFSDGLRDQEKCDPVTNRRMFDNGYRRDGTPIGNPVLGALCDPVPLRPLDVDGTARLVTRLAGEAAKDVLGPGYGSDDQLRSRVDDVRQLVAPSFSRAVGGAVSGLGKGASDEDAAEKARRQAYSMDLYSSMRVYGEAFVQKQSEGGRNILREAARKFDLIWGRKLLEALAPRASRRDFVSAFPLPDLLDTEERPYDEGALLDALGTISVALTKMQDGGLIGHWEISIPKDDYGSVVTIAVDDDISIGAQVFLSEQGRLPVGSAVTALARSAMEGAKISYSLDSFFIDPSTTRQELYNPTQLLLSLSNLGE